MKFKKLNIHNIASIEHAEIDFQYGPLAENPIFLITGPTGAGKSSILDCICLALYNKSPRTERGDDNRGTEDDLTAKDTRGLMRMNTGEASVELMFDDKNGVETVASWSICRSRKKTDGNLQKVVREVRFGDKVLTSKKDIDAHIADVIGLNFEQFCKTTMLPQGEFAKFLTGKDEERTEILEKLTGTGIYKKISRAIYDRMIARKIDLNNKKAELKGVYVYSEEEINQRNKQISEARQQVEKANGELKGLNAKKQWLTEKKTLVSDLEKFKAEKNVAETNLNAPQITVDKQLVLDYETSSDIRKEYADLNRIEIDIREKSKILQDNKENALECKSGIERLNIDIRNLEKSQNELCAILDKEAPNAMMYQNFSLLESLINNINRNNSENKTVNVRIAELNISLQNHIKENVLTETQIKEAKTALSNAELEMKKKSEELKYLNLAGVLQQKEVAELRHRNLNDFSEKYNNYIASEKSKIEVEKAFQDNEKETLTVKVRLGEVVKDYDLAQADLKKTEERYDKMKCSCDGFIIEIRKNLHVGDTCPLCGCEITEALSDDQFETILAPVKEQMDEIKTRKNGFEQLKNELTVRWDNLLKIKKQLEQKLDEVIVDYEFKSKSLKNTVLYSEFSKSDNIVEDIETAKKNISKEIDVLYKRLSSGENVRTQLDGLTGKISKLTEELQNLSQKQSQFNLKKVDIESQIKSLEENIRRIQQENTDIVERIQNFIMTDEWLKIFNESKKLFVHNLKASSEEYADYLTKDQTFSRQLEQMYRTSREAKAEYEEIVKFYPDLDDVETESAAVKDLVQKCSAVKMLSATLNDDILKLSATQNEIVNKISVYHSDGGLPVDRIKELIIYSDATIKAKRDNIENLIRILSNKEELIKIVQNKLAELDMSKPDFAENENSEILSNAIDEITAAVKSQEAVIVKLQTELNTNSDNVARLRDILVEIEKLSVEYNNWKSVCDIFGSANGETFNKIAQSYVLRDLLVYANQHLAQFTDQFLLVCQPGSLQILIKDRYNGDTLRHVNKISGGETFMISLALALGLASLNSGAVNVDTLFIDEGFGSLDEDTLSTVINCLERLNRNNGKKVGIISHVQELRDRIFTQIQVTKSRNVSRVEVVVNN